jgi:patatin-like phospholipase/acyl hydrolase
VTQLQKVIFISTNGVLTVGEIQDEPRILTLDGGGIRGLSSLYMLDDIMQELRRASGLPEPPRPCQYFDLIGGTSTGGLIAIMLGRLGMVYALSICA